MAALAAVEGAALATAEGQGVTLAARSEQAEAGAVAMPAVVTAMVVAAGAVAVVPTAWQQSNTHCSHTVRTRHASQVEREPPALPAVRTSADAKSAHTLNGWRASRKAGRSSARVALAVVGCAARVAREACRVRVVAADVAMVGATVTAMAKVVARTAGAGIWVVSVAGGSSQHIGSPGDVAAHKRAAGGS